MAKAIREEARGYEYAHATPWPVKGMRRMRLDAARRGDPLISKAAWLNARKGKKKS